MRRFTFMFADLAGFTALTEAHGDTDAAQVALRFAALARATLRSAATVVKTIGDAVMVVSPDAGCAVRCALDIRRAVGREPAFLSVRTGIHCGPAVESGGDYFGAAVNLAARVAAHARAGQILCTDAVAREASAIDGVQFRVAGIGHFKNVLQPVPLYEVVDSDARSPVLLDPVCRMSLPAQPAASVAVEGVEYFFCSPACAAAFAANPGPYLERLNKP